MNIIQVNSSFVKAVKWIKYLIAGNVGEAMQIAPFGDDSTPPKNTKGLYTSTLSAKNPVILGYFNRNQITEAGEKRIFSVKEDNSISTYVYCKKDGILELGGNANFAVKYNELKTEYDKTKGLLEAVIQTINTPVNEPGNGSPSAFQAVLISAIATKTIGDISSAKNDKIKTI